MECYSKFSILLILLILLGCKDQGVSEKEGIWKDTKTIAFDSENITLKIPKSFKRSSKYAIHRDIPILKMDSLKLVTIQNALTYLEFDDSEIDVFVDTSQRYRFVIMLNTIKFPSFDKKVGSQLKAIFNKQNREFEIKNFGYRITELDSKIAGNESMKMLKFKYKIENTFWGGVLYKSIYFLFKRGQTIVVHEYSENRSEIGEYLWSFKN